MIDVSRISSKGQVTIPIEIRKALKLKEGEKVAFILDDNGRAILTNASLLALQEAQNAFAGVAEKLGLQNESEIPNFIKNALED